MNNSFQKMFNWEQVEIAVSINEVYIYEGIDADGLIDSTPMAGLALNGKIDTALRVREWDNEVKLPAYPVKIEVEQRSYSDLSNKEIKFPLGMIKFEENEIYIRLFVRQELLNTNSQQLFAVVNGTVMYTVTIPFVESYLHGLYYPILGYRLAIKAQGGRA